MQAGADGVGPSVPGVWVVVVDLRTAVARAYDNWHVEVLTQGFKDVLAQGFEIGYDLSILGIVRVEAVVDAIL